jgi:hypothetical protein
MFPAKADLDDGAGHALVTAYALQRPDGQWSLLVVNRDQDNAHKVRIRFRDEAARKNFTYRGEVSIATFGRDQYRWHPARTIFMAHAEHDYDSSVQTEKPGIADPDGPPLASKITAGDDTAYDLPRASITVLRGQIAAK